MFIAYINVTREDEKAWDSSNHLRMCLHIWETDTGAREMVRFVNKNPFYDAENDKALDADFVAQTSFSKENIDDPTFFCSRRHDWEGLNTEVSSFNREDLKIMEEKAPIIKDSEAYKMLM